MPNEETKPEATVLVVFGGAGDLAWRKVIAAVYNVFLDKYLPERFRFIGVDIKDLSPEAYRDHLREGVNGFSRRGPVNTERWSELAGRIDYVRGDFDDPKLYEAICSKIESIEKAWNTEANQVFYMAIPPRFLPMVVGHLGTQGLCGDPEMSRVVAEKPFGHDLASAAELNRLLRTYLQEKQIYRIDHYLGKETVQNIIAFRFANAMFEPLWNRNYIDHVQISVAEQSGIGHRGGYYDHAGALRDMIQNHLMQLLCMIAMEAPVSFDADEVRNKKVDVLRAIRPFREGGIGDVAVRGQYGAGWVEGERAPAYRDEDGVSPDSSTETFAALKFFVDNWRWHDVPFYLRTGKRMPQKASCITIQFRPVPHRTFPDTALSTWQPNRLIVSVQPQAGIRLRFQAKQPGLDMKLSPVDMIFNYSDAYSVQPPEAYETLLLDVMQGDATLFMREDQVQMAWEVISPVLNAWSDDAGPDFPNYQAGSWGPEEAEALIARDGRNWVMLPLADGEDEHTADDGAGGSAR